MVNAFVTLVPLPATFQTTRTPTGCPQALSGPSASGARLAAKPTSPPLADLVVAVTTLTDGNLLQNAEGGPGGVGARVPVPQQAGFADGVLHPGESVEVPLVICLTKIAPFTLLVDVRGATP